MSAITQKILSELEKLTEHQRESVYDYILQIENKDDTNYLNNALKQGYEYLAEEHKELAEKYDANDLVE
jgi:hypothetical protein